VLVQRLCFFDHRCDGDIPTFGREELEGSLGVYSENVAFGSDVA
jgi:hypothetical protein